MHEKHIPQVHSNNDKTHEIMYGDESPSLDPPPYNYPSLARPRPPPSGYRIPLSINNPLTKDLCIGDAPCIDADGSSIYIGSAFVETPTGLSVHPCKIGFHLARHAAVPYGGMEHPPHGRYDVLPFDEETMEFVPTSHGEIPPGRYPIAGGYEENGERLYHAVAVVQGVRVPGKTGKHLGGCNVPFGGRECAIEKDYEILCWKLAPATLTTKQHT